MKRNQLIKLALIGAFAVIALGGWLLHFIIHSPFKASFGYFPFIVSMISVIVLPVLFWFNQTVAYAYVVNTILVILGTISMSHFSIVRYKGPITLPGLFLGTLFADILILWSSFLIGRALFELDLLKSSEDMVPKGTLRGFFRYPRAGWVFVHLISLSVVYALGHILWK